MMHSRLREVMDFLERQREAVWREAERLGKERWEEVPAHGGWSVMQVLEHLRLSEAGVVRLCFKIGKGIQKVGEGAVPATNEVSTTSVLRSLDHLFGGRGMTDRSVKRVAPEMVSPGPALDVDTVEAGLRKTRADLRTAVALLDGLALGEYRWTHAVLGELDLYQWLLFVGQHDARHTAQLREIVDAATGGAAMRA